MNIKIKNNNTWQTVSWVSSGNRHRGPHSVTLDLAQVTERRAPKKMGSSAMTTRLPYASAVPCGVATNFAVAFSASVPLESVALKASRTAAASEAAAGICSASDMALHKWDFRRTADGHGGDWPMDGRGSCGCVVLIHLPGATGGSVRPRFLKQRAGAEKRYHSFMFLGAEDHPSICFRF